jgi:cysteine-rich repeat protein
MSEKVYRRKSLAGRQGRRSPLCTSRPDRLGLALSAAALAVALLPGRASAQTSTLIDDFSVEQPRALSTGTGVEGASTSAGQQANIVGGERDIAVTRRGGGGDAKVDVFLGSGVLSYSMDSGTFGTASIVWDGNDDAGLTSEIDFDGLRNQEPPAPPVDLTFSGLTDQLTISFAAPGTDDLTATLILYANAGTSASFTASPADGTQALSFRFSDLTIAGPGPFDITDVGAIRLDVSSDTPAVDVDVDIVEASSSVTVTMVDRVFDSAGNPKSEPALPGDIIRYTVTVENPDDPGGLASTPQTFTFDPDEPLTNKGLTALVTGSVNVPTGATVVVGNGPGHSRVEVTLPAIPDRTSTGACPTDNTVAGCVSFTFDVVVDRVLPPDLLEGSFFIPAQGTLTSTVQAGRVSTQLRTNDPDRVSPPRGTERPLKNLTQVAGFCGDGEVDPGEGCDNPGGGASDFCTDDCRIRSVELCPAGQTCPAPGCTPGAANCPVCNDDPPGDTGDASCESGFCNPDENVCQSCSDGNLDAGEGCDDGNLTGGDGCNAVCLIEPIEEIGDCSIDDCVAPPANCTPGSDNCPRCNDAAPGLAGGASCASGFCSNLGGVAVCMNCGNGAVDNREGCDNPGRAPNEECTASCLITSCPTGVDCDPTCTITPGTPSDPTCHACTGDDQCDSMDCRDNGSGMGICVIMGCGDGVLQPNEGCDDGNRADGDGCNAACLVESCTTYPNCDRACEHVPGTPSTTTPPCSACNDTEPGRTGDDSCASGVCDRDDGTGVCVPAPVCGNGTLDIGEGCDDGNTMSDDGCNEMCRVESIEVIGDCRLGDCLPPVSCTPGSPDCAACNTTSPGETGDASCASGYCNPDGFCQDCGDGNLDTYEGCDDQNNADNDGCNATCLIESCAEGQSCPPAPDCTPGSPDCNRCNSDPAGATGDASCESGYCDPRTNTCGPRLPRLGGGGCSATTADAGIGLGLLIVMLLGWLHRCRRSAALAAAAILAGTMAFPHAARAQDEDARNFSAERFKLSSDRDGILDVESGTVIGHLNWDLGFWLGYADDPLALYMDDGDERINSFLTRRIGGELVAAIGFGKRLQLGLQIPVILDQNYTFMDASLAPESSAGLGDISVHPKLQLLFAGSHGVDLAIIPTVTLPSRGSESYFGDVSLTFAPMVALSRRMGRLGLGGNLGYRARADGPEVLGLEVVDEVFTRFGASYRVNSNPEMPLDLGLSASLTTAASDFFGLFNRNHAEGLAGANYQVANDWNLFAGGGIGLNAGFGTPDWRVLGGLRFSKRPLVCEQPLVARNRQCVRECDDPYVERDGQCALPPCPAGYDRVGTECMLKVQCDGNPPNKDADCDTLPAPPWIQLGPPDEAYDKGRTEPKTPGEPVDPSGYKFGGVVPPEDGKTDFPESITEYDYCPTIPGKVEHHGCPPPSVVADACTEGKDRGSITVGPDITFLPDSAVLTLPSRVPLEELARVVAREPGLLVAINVGSPNANHELAQRRAESVAAFLQKNGINVDSVSIVGFGAPAGAAADEPSNYPVSFERRCPGNVPSTTVCKSIELGDDYKIEYEVNSDVIRPASKEMLKRDVLWILQAHPQVRVEVQGHTSSEGRLEYNMDLSRRRAQSVVAYLVGEGVAADRLTAVGHGPKIPLVSPETTEIDREKNRRIEFSVRPRKECDTCTRFEVGKIQFEFNSGVIKPESFPELDSVVRKLLANPAVHLFIEGHTSSEGSARHNRRLSGVRAAAVRKYLVEKGVAQGRLDSKGFGEDKLLIPADDTEEQREINRRVEFVITKGKPECLE